MKTSIKVIALVALCVVSLLAISVQQAEAQNLVVVKAGTLAADAIDTSYFDVSKTFDYFGLAVRSDSIARIFVYVDISTRATGAWQQVVADSLSTVTTTGGFKIISLRSAVAEAVPFGANVLRFRFAKQASGNGGATKVYIASMQGIKIRAEGE